MTSSKTPSKARKRANKTKTNQASAPKKEESGIMTESDKPAEEVTRDLLQEQDPVRSLPPKIEVVEDKKSSLRRRKEEPVVQQTERIGDILHRVRRHRGEDLYAVADYLRIRPIFLDALEKSEYSVLPAEAYVVGFLRSYADYLGLDGQGAVEHYRHERTGSRKAPSLSMPQPVAESRSPTIAMIAGGLVIFLAVYALWYGVSSSNRTSIPEPELPVIEGTLDIGGKLPEKSIEPAEEALPEEQAKEPEEQGIPLSAKDEPAKTEETASDKPEEQTIRARVFGDTSSESRIVIRAETKSWILITDKKGNTLFDRNMQAGESYRVPPKQGLSLTTGNAGGIVINLDGKDLPRMGEKGRVVRALTLRPKDLVGH